MPERLSDLKILIGEYERRAGPGLELRVEGDETKPVIAGYAAVFNQEVEIGPFREVIRPGAFMGAIAEDDVRFLFNHEESTVMARNRAGTLRLAEDDRGLKVEADVNPDDDDVRRLITKLRRGDVTQMSFAFQTLEEKWNQEPKTPLREVLKVRLFDVSAVTFPAYPQTTVAVRSRAQELAEAWRHDLARRKRLLTLAEAE
jgi:hypothetical protein